MFALHLLCIFSLLVHHVLTGRLKNPKPILVKTVTLKAPSLKSQTASIKKKAPPALKAPTPKALSQKAGKKKAAKPAIGEKTPLKKEKALVDLEKALKSFEALSKEEKKAPPKEELQLPSFVELKPEILLSPEERGDKSYENALVYYLQNSLELPEIGDVKAHLEIHSSGKLLSFEILESQSKKNEEFLKKRLPELSFPCLNSLSNQKTSQNFTIVFKNVEKR